MSRIDTSLSDTFGIPNIERTENLPVVVNQAPEQDDLDADIAFVRGKLESLINKGESAIEMLTDIARAEESPRSFEVLNTMLSTMSELSMQFISLHEKKAKIAKAKEKPNGQPLPVNTTNNTTNIAFVGSSSDLDALLEQRRQKKRELKDLQSEQETVTVDPRPNT